MKQQVKAFTLHALKTLGYGTLGALLMLLVVGILMLNSKQDLKVWHTASLDEEFTARDKSVKTFTDYLALEDRLFAQLDEKVYQKIGLEDQNLINRYHRGSLSDPERWERNWNRSFELEAEESSEGPKLGVLLIHGLSDSPYSLRSIGEKLHSKGAHVVGIRVPGHGTAPSGLTRTKWQDMAAAVEIGMQHLKGKVGDRPVSIIGYSNGGALALHYTLCAIEDEELPAPESLVLISPEIGISRMAAMAIWQERIGSILFLKKLQWNSVQPEYDPYKYGSFAVNAGDLAHKLTNVNRKKIAKLSRKKRLSNFPQVLTFQSLVDATVSVPALVTDLFDHLPERDHELVLFGMNRAAMIDSLFAIDPASSIPGIREDPNRNFTLSVLVNRDEKSELVTLRTWKPRESEFSDQATDLSWPNRIYSLSHVALPFRGNDPVYGGVDPEESPGISLGGIVLRGEKGVLKIAGNDMLRLRWNPFYTLMEDRILEQLGLEP